MTGRKNPPIVTAGSYQAGMSILWEPTKICHGSDSSSGVWKSFTDNFSD